MPRKVFRSTSLTLARFGLLFAIFLTIFPLMARLHWRFEILTHFRFQILFGILGVFLLCLILKLWKELVAASLCSLPHLFAIAPQILPYQQPQPVGPSLKVISFNVLTSNKTPEQAVSWLLAQDADLILLTETGHNWNHLLLPLDRKYPHRIHHPRSDNFGLSFYSQLPITSAHPLNTHQLPFLFAELDWQGQPLYFAGAHPTPPSNAHTAHVRNWTLDHIARLGRTSLAPLIVCGDLNCTPWSPHFQPLRDIYNDTSRGQGYEPTWQRNFPLFAIPIDHLLLKGNLTCTSRSIGPQNGSDHSPIIAMLARSAS